MKKTIYRIRRDGGGWAMSVHGRLLRFDTLDGAVGAATLTARTELLCGGVASIAIQQDNGGWAEQAVMTG